MPVLCSVYATEQLVNSLAGSCCCKNMCQVFADVLVNMLCLQAAFGVGKGANTQELTILDGLNGVLKPVRGPNTPTGWSSTARYTVGHWLILRSCSTLLQAGAAT
jgi:hypothetical protein